MGSGGGGEEEDLPVGAGDEGHDDGGLDGLQGGQRGQHQRLEEGGGRGRPDRRGSRQEHRMPLLVDDLHLVIPRSRGGIRIKFPRQILRVLKFSLLGQKDVGATLEHEVGHEGPALLVAEDIPQLGFGRFLLLLVALPPRQVAPFHVLFEPVRRDEGGTALLGGNSRNKLGMGSDLKFVPS